MRQAIFVITTWLALAFAELRAESPVAALSPDGRARIEISLLRAGETESVPHFRVTFGDVEVIGNSRLGVELEDGSALGGPCEILAVESREIRETFTQVTGKRKVVVNHANEVSIRFRETMAPQRIWEVIARAHDDGVAFRYRFPSQPGWNSIAIRQERTEFRTRAEAQAFALPLASFTTPYENRYAIKPVADLPNDGLIGLPLLLEDPARTWFAITEANVQEYAGMYLLPSADGSLATRLAPLPKEPGVAVRTRLPSHSPWRVVMVGDRVGRLIESDIVLALNDP